VRKLIFLVVLVVSCYLSVSAATVEAKIIRAADEVDSSPILYSTIKLRNEPWESVGLWRVLKPDAPYHLELVTDGYKEWIFFDGQVSMNIKGIWYDLITKQQNTKNEWPNTTTTAEYAIPQPVIEQLLSLKETDTVELRLSFRDKTYVAWKVPDKMLLEWQQLIQRLK